MKTANLMKTLLPIKTVIVRRILAIQSKPIANMKGGEKVKVIFAVHMVNRASSRRQSIGPISSVHGEIRAENVSHRVAVV